MNQRLVSRVLVALSALLLVAALVLCLVTIWTKPGDFHDNIGDTAALSFFTGIACGFIGGVISDSL